MMHDITEIGNYFLAFIFGSIITFVLWQLHKAEVNSKTFRLIEGINRLKKLRLLITEMQRHRGTSYTALKGGEAIASKLPALERNISKFIESLRELKSQADYCERWNSFTDHWSRLHKNNLALSDENNMEQHNKIVCVLIYLFEDIADSSGFSKSLEKQKLAFWLDALRASEWAGQTRALGAGIIASGKIQSVETIRLRFLVQKLETEMNRKGLSKESRQAISEFLEVVHTCLLDTALPKISASDYFTTATKAIDALLAQTDDFLENESQRIGGRSTAKISGTKKISYGIT